MERPQTYCVTGASGYIGSWLVKTLIERGNKVHATVKDFEKAHHLLSLGEIGKELKLFEADLQEEGSFDEPIAFCDGVFHVAASMQFQVNESDDLDNYVKSTVIGPAVRGTLNVLRSCSKSKSVKRVVFTSSISTLTALNRFGLRMPVVDETSLSSVDHVWETKAPGWVYVLSKLHAEEAALKYCNDHSVDFVSVITTTVAGPFLTPSVPSSVRTILSPLTGETTLYSILSAVNDRMGSVGIVHIEDICNAHIFLMENKEASGRYIACAGSCSLSELSALLSQSNPSSSLQRFEEGRKGSRFPEISSEKMRNLGFICKFSIEDTIRETVMYCENKGFIPSTIKN